MENCDSSCIHYKNKACSLDIAQHDEQGNCIDKKERSVRVLVSGEGAKIKELFKQFLNEIG